MLANVQKKKSWVLNTMEFMLAEGLMANNHLDKECADDDGHLTRGGFTGHAVGSHNALDGFITYKEDYLHIEDQCTPWMRYGGKSMDLGLLK